MQHFLRENDVLESSTQFDTDRTGMTARQVVDMPTYADPVDISRINIRNRGSYTKDALFKIIREIFDPKTLPGSKKTDAVRFLLEPDNLEKILYNNEMVDRQTVHGRRSESITEV